jgi:hypothetical protein
MRRGIREAGATQLMTAHISPATVSSEWDAFAPYDDLRGVYPGTPAPSVSSRSAAAYRASPPKPTYLFEPTYELEAWDVGFPGSAANVRALAWWGQLGGRAGVFYGHRDVWPFQTGTWCIGYPFGCADWTLGLDDPGAVAMEHMARLLATLDWWKLVPSGLDGMTTLVTSGGGTLGTRTHVAAAADRGGTLLLAYLPADAARNVTLDLRVMGAPATASWWNPATGGTSPIGTFPNDGTRTFTAPAGSGGGDDWLLILSSP